MRGKCEREALVGDWSVIYGLSGYVSRWGQIVNISKNGFAIRVYNDDNKDEIDEFLGVQYWKKSFVEVFATKDEAYDHFCKEYKEAVKEGIRGSLD